jgi:hypothetical protein
MVTIPLSGHSWPGHRDLTAEGHAWGAVQGLTQAMSSEWWPGWPLDITADVQLMLPDPQEFGCCRVVGKASQQVIWQGEPQSLINHPPAKIKDGSGVGVFWLCLLLAMWS